MALTTLDAAKIITAAMFPHLSDRATAGQIREASSLAAAEIMLGLGISPEVALADLDAFVSPSGAEPEQPAEPEAPFSQDRR